VTPQVIVPALTPLDRSGSVDRYAARRYSRRAAATWIDAFLLSGSTTRGDLLSVSQRAQVLDAWLQDVPPSRLIACCWQPGDIEVAHARQVRAMMVMRDLPDRDAALRFLADLPPQTTVYSHPMYTATVLDADLATDAAAAGVLPPGGKVAKISLDGIARLRLAAGAHFALWDGSSRHVAESVRAGASGVIATPLSDLPEPFPARSVATLQPVLDASQAHLDALPGRTQRTEWLVRRAFHPAPTPR
jgi:dihydrodipicolinate synthase/N-acetylneuraminate lyase